MEEETPKISFNLGDYINRMTDEVRRGFEKLDTKLDAKADKSAVEEMRHDLDGVKGEVQKLKTNMVTQDALRRFQAKFLWLVAASVIAALMAALGDVIGRVAHLGG